MESKEIKKLILELQKPQSAISVETKQAFIRHAGEKEVLDTFADILKSGKRSVRVKLVEILSDILSKQAFELLLFALQDPYLEVRNCVSKNLKKGANIHKRADDDYQKSLEELVRVMHRSETPEKIAAIVEERNREYDRKLYFLPLIETRLKNDKDMDLAVRGELLSILQFHDALDGIDNLMDAMMYGEPDLKMYAVEKLDWILNDATRNKIRFVMLERLRQEFHPDVKVLLKKALSPEYKSGEPAIYFSSSWFEDAVLFFRKIGFFQEYRNLADHELIERIKEARQYDPDNKLPSTIDLLLILAEDKKRVWFRDAETYFDQEYVNLLKEWGNISRGTFSPENIVETRIATSDENDKKILISFSHKDKPREIYVNDYGDWIDTSIFGEINEIIGDSGNQFFSLPTDSQEVCIVSITASEKLQLEKYLRLKFEISGRFIFHPKL